MTTNSTDKKRWESPAVQNLNINKDTYVNKGRGEREVGKGGGTNKDKDLPS